MQSTERDCGQEAENHARLAGLLDRARHNDKDAIVLLLQEYAPELFETIRACLPQHIRSAFDSADFFQELVVALVKLNVYPAFISPQAFLTYAAKMAKNAVLMEVRKQINAQKRDIRRQVALSALENVEDLVDKEISTLDRIIQDEEWEAVLNSEPPVHRIILQLRCAGFTLLQIADATKLTERTVRSLLTKTIQRQAAKIS